MRVQQELANFQAAHPALHKLLLHDQVYAGLTRQLEEYDGLPPDLEDPVQLQQLVDMYVPTCCYFCYCCCWLCWCCSCSCFLVLSCSMGQAPPQTHTLALLLCPCRYVREYKLVQPDGKYLHGDVPTMGIIRLDYFYSENVGDVGSAASYDFGVLPAATC